MKKAPAPTKTQGAFGEQLSFLPPPPFCPQLPKPHSKAAQALDDMMAESITQLDWLERGQGWRLAAAVKELDYLGWEPKAFWVYGDWRNPIKGYCLTPEAKRAFRELRRPKGGAHAASQ